MDDTTGGAVVLQPDEKILVAGSHDDGTGSEDFALARYNTDGSLDTSFDTDGKVITDFAGENDFGNAVALQQDGKIIVAGSSDIGGKAHFASVRYNNDGSLDPTFDMDGRVVIDFGTESANPGAVVIQSDGKIVMAGSSAPGMGMGFDFALTRQNSDGSLDTTFGSGGIVITDFGNDVGQALAIQPDGRLIVAGFSYDTSAHSDFAVARYDGAGSATEVTIDVKPGRFPNRIEVEKNVCKDIDHIHVAILTTPAFDALTVDAASLKLGDPLLSGTASPLWNKARDVDLDGDLDMLLSFTICDLVTNLALDSSSTELDLTGTTLGGDLITGTDSVKVVHA
jgi:uncharacterized delta-60 repeat protein